MIRYALKCSEGHVFESWFQSASAFDVLEKAGHLSCAVCGVSDVKKSLMAPQVVADKDKDKAPEPLAAEPADQADPIAEMRRAVEENATYVGGKFAQKARDMHEGSAPEESIYGEANAQEARALIEDGVPVVPLPFKPKQKLQ
ncbi:DUF1178 family protein [Sulfitobacter donghicola]|uniref:Uncharacterized protein n=1 Tax=Sulfitobacter donghicola DSW-25 = KCTC 12864 = JCM 14565 TaxID=1300350 RepID=A0A073IFK9_9RHOB|nr:DUF1178 family protein [Sulfitobacter donghicola]KEJ88291.1 hypothetical protein DSW25_16580 [Sulfitobacter donghicola DSW-25 = KCTC 12864 = JCM 14565]KIN68886.1 hypothetical protein Z948_2618 [Sulfitobacter donghicola DSW-25 = KCTC 12864 = JCM 14565]